MNRLLSKGMSNNYLEVTIEKNWSSKFKKINLLSLQNCHQLSFRGAPIHANITEF